MAISKLTSPREMCVLNTPVEDYTAEFGLFVKREDLCCPGGPNFSKTRGVFSHIKARPEKIIGVLDTSHSQGGWAVARACSLLGKKCVLYYPVRKADRVEGVHQDPQRGAWGDILREPQIEAAQLGASLAPLEAGRSAILYHRARKSLDERGYMMPNALKLPETVAETAIEYGRTILPDVDTIVVSASSATIASGVILGVHRCTDWVGTIIVHMGYSRPEHVVLTYIRRMTGLGVSFLGEPRVDVVDEEYGYADAARSGVTPPFPCNAFYDLKAFRWWLAVGRAEYKRALFWNVG